MASYKAALAITKRTTVTNESHGRSSASVEIESLTATVTMVDRFTIFVTATSTVELRGRILRVVDFGRCS